MGLKAGWLALFVFVWLVGAFLGSTFEYQSADAAQGQAYSTGTATFTNGSRTVTGAGTVWVAAMEDGLMQSDTDLVYYKINNVVNNTELTLYGVYEETGGAGHNYTMVQSPGWSGAGGGGYAESPITTMEYLTNVSNVVQRTSILGAIPMITPNGDYFKAAVKVVTWQWSFMDGYEIFYWIFCGPFVVMGILSMILLIYGVITGNLTLT